MTTVELATPTIKEQIKATFTDWIEIGLEPDQALWHEHRHRVTKLLRTATYPHKLLKLMVELVDPSYGTAVQLRGQLGDEQVTLCSLLKQGRYEATAGAAPSACALMFALAANPQSVDFGDLTDEEMGTLASIGIVQTNLEQKLTDLMTSVEHQVQVIGVCTYHALIARTLDDKQGADIGELLELVADKLVVAIS